MNDGVYSKKLYWTYSNGDNLRKFVEKCKKADIIKEDKDNLIFSYVSKYKVIETYIKTNMTVRRER